MTANDIILKMAILPTADFPPSLRREIQDKLVAGERARAALEEIRNGIDPYEDQAQNWIAGIADRGLGA